MNPERIHNLNERIRKLEDELQAERNRNRSVQSMVEATSWQRFITLNAALGQYKDSNVGVLTQLLHVLQQAVDAQDPLRAAPMSDTARVGHSELTSTEAAVVSKRKERATVRNAARMLENVIDRVESDMTGDRVKVPAKRCHKATCRGKRSPAEARFCVNCGRPFGEEEAA